MNRVAGRPTQAVRHPDGPRERRIYHPRRALSSGYPPSAVSRKVTGSSATCTSRSGVMPGSRSSDVPIPAGGQDRHVVCGC